MKKILFILFVFAITDCLPLQAQTGFFGNIWEWFTREKSDTLYVARSVHPFSIKARTTTIINTSDLEWQKHDSSLSLLAQPTFKAGFHISYRGIGLGFQKDVGNLFSKKGDENMELSASAYGRVLGGDFSYSTSSHYSINKLNGVICDKDIEGVKSRRMYANAYYVFNNRKFSYPAALTQSYRQKRNCGSVIAGLSFIHNTLELEPDAMSAATEGKIPVSHIIKHSVYNSLSINCGYGYNWVIDRQWMLHGTALPSLSFINKLEYKLGYDTVSKRNNLDIGCIVRFGALWNYERYYAGFTALMYVYGTGYNTMSMTDMHAKLQMSVGVRF